MPSGISAVSAASAFAIRSATSALQLRFDLARMLVRQRAVPAGVGVDLRAVQRHRAHLQHAHLARQQQHLNEQRLDLFQKPTPERRDRVVVGMIVGGDETKRHRVIGRPLQLAARKHARRIAVNQNAEQHARVIRRRAGAAISSRSSRDRSSPSITSTTKRARCFSGSHSSTDGGSKKPVSRSIVRKLVIGQPRHHGGESTPAILSQSTSWPLSPTGC